MPNFGLRVHFGLLNLNKIGTAQKLYKAHIIKF
jgi:hypothetical protein